MGQIARRHYPYVLLALGIAACFAAMFGCGRDGLGTTMPDGSTAPDLKQLCAPVPLVEIQDDINPQSSTVIGGTDQLVLVFGVTSQISMMIDLQGLIGSLNGLHNLEGARWEVRVYALDTVIATGTVQSNKLYSAQQGIIYVVGGVTEVFQLLIDSSTASPGHTLSVELSGPIHYSCDQTWQEVNFSLKSATFTYARACNGLWTPPTVGCQNESAACDDGNPCTQKDTCQQGVCKGSWNSYCIPCRSGTDCCGNTIPAYCPGLGESELVTDGICRNGTCNQVTSSCGNRGCSYPGGCY